MERLLTAREVAGLLGISSHTVLDWFEADVLPGFRLHGRVVRFRESELVAWVDAQRSQPAAAQPRLAVVSIRRGGEGA